MNDSRVIIALDLESAAEARAMVEALGDAASFYKVGLELFASAGVDFVRELKARGHRVFLDLKFLDIGETVRRAVIQVAHLGVDFLTVHASMAAMQAAAAGRNDSGLKLLAVTVLTSADDSDLRQDGYALSVADLVGLRVRNAMEARMDGLICSPLEVARVRTEVGAGPILVTPGVRSAGAALGDQKRVATPAAAVANGADYVVIGRQITRAADPRSEMLRVIEEIGVKSL
jgi:orotidine-5'-phosphate decarboxylase